MGLNQFILRSLVFAKYVVVFDCIIHLVAYEACAIRNANATFDTHTFFYSIKPLGLI
jgi:hypothetical protein